NYDYQLAIYLMNNVYYMTNDCIVLVENEQLFSPIGTLHYSFYQSEEEVTTQLKTNEQVQAVTGTKEIPFGYAQQPGLMDYADGVDVMAFLLSL
ncbi:MAG: acyl-CoA reductase, partial [Lacibacter sp.]